MDDQKIPRAGTKKYMEVAANAPAPFCELPAASTSLYQALLSPRTSRSERVFKGRNYHCIHYNASKKSIVFTLSRHVTAIHLELLSSASCAQVGWGPKICLVTPKYLLGFRGVPKPRLTPVGVSDLSHMLPSNEA